MEEVIKIYCDGACSGNPGPGGWGAVLLWRDIKHELSGFSPNTTNNKMELTAAIKGLEAIKANAEVPLQVYTDSQYVKEGITTWIHKWIKTGWKNGKVKNIDLWKELYELQLAKNAKWFWVLGHAGNVWNERADQLARNAILQNKL